jgi:hypothetical protein
MRRSTKAALISGLVLPGLGHVFLRKYLVGLVLLCLAGWSIYEVVITAVDTALDIASEIESGSVVLDSASLSQLVAQRSQYAEGSTNIPVWVLIASWVIGIADSYRVGRAQERQEGSPVVKKT